MTFDNYSAEFPLTSNLPVWDYVQEVNNVKITWETAANSGDAYKNMVTPRMAAGIDLPDIVCVGNFEYAAVQKFGQSGQILALDDYIDKYAPDMKKTYADYPVIDATTRASDGRRYTVDYMSGNEGASLYAMFIRQDWLDKLGLPVPATADELYDVSVAMRNGDANGNGVKDEVISIFPSFRLYSHGMLCGSFGLPESMDWFADKNGVVQYSWVTPEAKTFLQYWARMYAAGVLDKESVSGLGYDAWIKKQAENKTMGVTNLNHMYNWFSANVTTDSNASYTSLIGLQGPAGTAPIIWRNPPSANPGYRWSITKSVGEDRIEAVMKFLNWFYTEDGKITVNYGVPGANYIMADGKPVLTDASKAFVKEKSFSDLMIRDGFGWNYMPAVVFQSVEEFAGNEGWPRQEIDKISSLVSKAVSLPVFSAASEDEAVAENDVGGDYRTYIDETLVEFITGAKSFSDWDAYVARANELGLSKLQKLKQAQYDRVNNSK